MKKQVLLLIFVIYTFSMVLPSVAQDYANVKEETGIDFTKMPEMFPIGMSVSKIFKELEKIIEDPSGCDFSDSFNSPIPDWYDPDSVHSGYYSYYINTRSGKLENEYPAVFCHNIQSGVDIALKLNVYKTEPEYFHFEVYRSEKWTREDLKSNYDMLVDYYRNTATEIKTNNMKDYESAIFVKNNIGIEIIAYHIEMTSSSDIISLSFDMYYPGWDAYDIKTRIFD